MPKHREPYSSQAPELEQQHRALGKSTPVSSILSGVSSYDNDSNDPDMETILEQYDFTYILAQVKRMAHLHTNIAHPAVLDLELEDIAQEVHIHLWQKLQEISIKCPKAYIARMICNQCIDAIRRRTRRSSPKSLPMADNGEVQEGDVLVVPSEGMADPADEFEQKVAIADCTNEVTEAISTLPPRQQYAMICSLKDRVDNLVQVVEAFEASSINIETIQWPSEKEDERLLKASLPAARRNIALRINVDLASYKK